MTRQPCDDAFDRDEKAFWKAAEKLLGAAQTCVRQAASDLMRACRLFRDPAISILGAHLVENLRGHGNFDNIREACHIFVEARRGNLNHQDPEPQDLVVIAAMNLVDACQHLLAEGASGRLSVDDLPQVGPDTVRSRVASEEILRVLRHQV